MIFKTNHYVIVAFFALFLCLSCEDEPIDPNLQNSVETILPNSDLANLIVDVSSADVVACVNFQYPISFTLYNSNFQVLETVTIQSDTALLAFLQSLGETENGVVLASLNFPVTLMYDNGTSLEVNNNQELEAAIMAASDHCSDTETCNIETVSDFLISCPQIPTLNDFTPSMTTFEFFESNELSTMYELDLPYSGTWDIATIEGELHLFINFNGLENFNGEWTVVNCTADELVLQQGDDTLIVSKDCDSGDNPFDCFGSSDAQLTLCDAMSDGVETFDLTQVFANCNSATNIVVSFHLTEVDAQANINAIANPTAFTNLSAAQTIYVRVELLTDGTYEVFPIQLILEDCECDNPATITSDLVIYMPFGNQVKDLISGNEILNSTNEFVADRDGNATCAIAFDGTQSITLPVTVQNQLVQGDSFSVSLWFKMQNTDAGDYEVMFQKGTADTGGFQIGVYDLNTPLVSAGNSLWDEDWNQEVDVQWENTDWHHLVVTRDSNNTIRLFRDGSLRNIVENSTVNIGSDPLESYLMGQGFQGHLDDLRVYKRTLDPDEIALLYTLSGECYQCL